MHRVVFGTGDVDEVKRYDASIRRGIFDLCFYLDAMDTTNPVVTVYEMMDLGVYIIICLRSTRNERMNASYHRT
jgi:hypothetical protein